MFAHGGNGKGYRLPVSGGCDRFPFGSRLTPRSRRKSSGNGLPLASCGHILGCQLIGFFKQSHLVVHGYSGRLLFITHTTFQLLQTGTHFLLFRIFSWHLIETAERAVDVLVSGSRSMESLLRSSSARAETVVSFRQIRLQGQLFGTLHWLPSCHLPEHGTEALHGTTSFLLLLFHHLLFIGFLLVADEFRGLRIRYFRVEPLRLFLPFFLRRSEDEPHGACKKQEHQGVNDKLLSPLSLFLRQLRRGARIGGCLSFEWEHNRNTLIG